MADNVAVTPGTGATIASDDIGGIQYQRAKITLGADGVATSDLIGTAARGAYVDPRLSVVRLTATPTISTGIYAAKDAVGTVMTFANAVRASGGSCRLDSVQVVDKAQVKADLDLVFFDRTITATTDNAVFDPTDTEITYVVAVVPVGGWYDFNDNCVADMPVGKEIVLNGTDLFGVLVSRGTPTYGSTSDLIVICNIIQD